MPWNTDLPESEWYTPDDPDLPLLVQTIEEDVPILAIDTETTGLDTVNDVPLFWSLSWGERRICMPASTLQLFAPVLSNPEKKWVLANAKYDQHILANVGLPLMGELMDVQVMHALLYEEQPHGLKYIAKTILGWEWSDFLDTFRLNKAGKLTTASPKADVLKGGSFQTVQDAILWTYHNDLPRLVEYAANDAYGTWKAYEELKKQLESTNTHSLYPETYRTLADYFFKIEVPFTRVLWSCERHGARIDASYLNNVTESVQKEMAQLEKEITREVGRPININSTKELQKYFFSELKVKPTKLTKGGKTGIRGPSVDAEVLEELSCSYKIAHLMVKWKELGKLLGTYAQGLPEHMDKNGRIHTDFRQSGARTGRLSSAGPNL
jgi:DNA polymerase-1